MDPNQNYNDEITTEDTIDLKPVIRKIINLWYVFAFSVFVSLFVGFLVSRYAENEYQVSSSLLINTGSSSSGTQEFLKEFNFISSSVILENEYNTIRSYTLLEEAIKRGNFDIRYYFSGNLKNLEMHPNAFEYKIIVDSNDYSILDKELYLSPINKDSVQLLIPSGDLRLYNRMLDSTYVVSSSQPIVLKGKSGEELSYFDFRIKIIMNEKLKEKLTSTPKDYSHYSLTEGNNIPFIVFHKPQELAEEYRNNLSISVLSDNSTILELKLLGRDPQRQADFLNLLCQVYMQNDLEEKNRKATNTVLFINDQLEDINKSLNKVESELKDFRQENQTMDVSVAIQKLFSEIENYEKEKSRILLEMKYYMYLKDYLKRKDAINDVVAPTVLGIEDNLLTNLISMLSELELSIRELKSSSTSDNPILLSQMQKVNNVRNKAIENINSVIEAKNIELDEFNNRIEQANNLVNQMPQKEREFLRMKRNFSINDEIYKFLLKKRAEANIVKASNTSDSEILDKANALYSIKTAPNTQLIFTSSSIIGFLFPLIIILLKIYFNDKLESIDMLKRFSSIQVLGAVAHVKKKVLLTGYNSKKNLVSESFRTLWANLNFILRQRNKLDKTKIIAITSSVSMEGKTFIAINMAITYANSGKKTLLLGADLRKPGLKGFIENEDELGLSTYLIGQSDLENSIQKHDEFENLYVLPAGRLQLNPGQLMHSHKMEELLKILRVKFDMVIIDTTPIIPVSDFFSILDKVDLILYIVRHNLTQKSMLAQIESINQQEKIDNIFYIYNDVSSGGGYRGGYYYSGNYGSYSSN